MKKFILVRKRIVILFSISIFLSCFSYSCGNVLAVAVVDNTPPEFKDIRIKDNPLELGKKVYIEAKIDDSSMINQVLIEFGGENHSMIPKAAKKWYIDNWMPYAIGDYPFTMYAEDILNNWNQISMVLIVVPDETPPNVTFVEDPKTEVERGEMIPIYIILNDVSGISQVLLEFNNKNNTMVNVPDSDVWKYEIIAPEEDGTYFYRILVQDTNNNWNITTKYFKVVSEPTEIKATPEINYIEIYSPFLIMGSVLFVLGFLTKGFIVKRKNKSFKSDREIQSINIKSSLKNVEKGDRIIQKPMKDIEIECPVCGTMKNIRVPGNLLSDTTGIKTVSIPKNTVCSHTFQVFLDRFFMVRGYQEIDYEIEDK